MKKTLASLLILAVLLTSVVVFVGCKSDTETLNVYNWGVYISNGKYGSEYDTIAEFEKYYKVKYGKTIKVNYTTYDSNEDMYAKIKSGASDYDVIFPSDYMAARMIEEGLVAKLDFNNIPNFTNIGDDFKSLYYDEKNEYTVPYTYGVIGIIYNANVVSPDVVEEKGWSIFWDEAYANKILMINNPRDAFGLAMYDLGIDVNTTDPAEWKRALDHLKAGKPLIQAYVMDEIFNKMESGEAAISTYYAGDYFTMLENADSSVDLRFYQPPVTNVFADVMCVPSKSQNKELAEIFIDFMLQRDAAVANAETLYYGTPNELVKNDKDYIDYLGDDAKILYPEGFDFKSQINKYGYRNLDNDTLDLISSLWEEMKIDSDTGNNTIYIVCGVIAAVAAATAVIVIVRKKKKNKSYDD